MKEKEMSAIVPTVFLILNIAFPGIDSSRINSVSIPEPSMKECQDIGRDLIGNETEHRVVKGFSNIDYPEPTSFVCVPSFVIGNKPVAEDNTKPLRG